MIKKIVLACSVISFFLLLAYILFNKPTPAGVVKTAAPAHPASDIAFPVQVTTAQRAPLILWINSGGLARPIREAEIVAQTSGRLDSLAAYNGQFVRKGALLARLDAAIHRIALTEAENNLLSARIEYNIQKQGPSLLAGRKRPEWAVRRLDSLAAEFNHALQRYQSGDLDYGQFQRIQRNYQSLLSYSDFDRDDVVANKSGLNQALVAQERALLSLSWCELRAPFDGYVADCTLNPGGGYVNAGAPCMKVIDLSRLKIIAEATETQITKIGTGHRAEVSFVAFPGERFRGEVAEINPYIDLEKRVGQVAITVENPAGRIKPGMYATVRIQGEVIADAVIVPRAALVIRDSRPVIFSAEDGLAKWHYVELGAENEDFYQILAGVVPGQSVIIGGNYNLAHDACIRVGQAGE